MPASIERGSALLNGQDLLVMRMKYSLSLSLSLDQQWCACCYRMWISSSKLTRFVADEVPDSIECGHPLINEQDLLPDKVLL